MSFTFIPLFIYSLFFITIAFYMFKREGCLQYSTCNISKPELKPIPRLSLLGLPLSASSFFLSVLIFVIYLLFPNSG